MPELRGHVPARLQPFRIAQAEHGAPGGNMRRFAQQEEKEERHAGEVPPAPLLFANAVFTAVFMVILGAAFTRKLHDVPKGFSNFGEWLAEQLRDFTVNTIGPGGERHVPLVGTIFLFILLMNLAGLIPGFHSPTSNISFTLALGVVVFIYVQYWGIRAQGIGGYLRHFMGPSLGVGGGKFPELFWLIGPIEMISEIIKPFTLAVRLFGNIFGEDVILIVLAGLAGTLAGSAAGWIPLQLPILFLALLTSLVQALVFSILTCIYLSLMTQHGHGDDHADHGDAGEVHAHPVAH
ncbi:MAG TPA: F0F1 ATP synthase subunit A [Chthonomonadaceae bacterium]|nr:F0F1 ATP synthase subunit A [Chthonomonadaceae bacterium]